MRVHIIYKETGEKVCTYYNCEEIVKDIAGGTVTLKFKRDEVNEKTILSPCSVRLEKFDILIEN